ncbi:hypothetical protein HMPREF1320_0054 [Capnocytophaga sp. oral taxon 335 str. F0486]|uniref:hypothetical protein n=1 Tax=Capnocytophaga sp. oral taxon 335 TaxID=712215 RepID=UPI00026F3C74|nr:hypothetical protein [Capnocytophaga sp. oral taxon 335]EJF35401.1 hypothetical protein HMPREF1320_0054 [Capnocytophaga sp. oral taxon 335 str. F0486]
MKQLILYLLLFCSWAIEAQEQKYILLDSLTANFEVKHYTLDTSPYGPKNTIEMYNVFSPFYGLNKNDDYIILFSILPDLSSKTNWEAIDFEKIKNNLFPTKNIFRRAVYKVFSLPLKKEDDISGVRLVKKVKDKYYVGKIIRVDDFYCIEVPREIQLATKNFILNTNQPIVPINVLKQKYKEFKPFQQFYLDDIFVIPDILEGVYLSNIEEKWEDTMYFFYQYSYYDNRGIDELVYIKDKGIVAGAYGDYFYPIGKIDRTGTKRSDWLKVIHGAKNRLLWAEELKKEWADKEKELENWKKGK